MVEEESLFDEKILEDLPPEAQRRLIQLGRDMIEADICRRYDLAPGSLLPELPDVIEKNLTPEEFSDLAERAALDRNPLKGKTPRESPQGRLLGKRSQPPREGMKKSQEKGLVAE